VEVDKRNNRLELVEDIDYTAEIGATVAGRILPGEHILDVLRLAWNVVDVTV
jgi:hypothetical protein